MKNSLTAILIFAGLLAAAAQAQDSLSGQDPVSAFLRAGAKSSVPFKEIRSGGPPVDGIPALSRPKKVRAGQADGFLDDGDEVLGVVVNGEATAYPIRLLNWHEIANDAAGGLPVAVTYCPLIRRGIVFERQLDIGIVEFGVSGLLYRGALVMYDRRTKSLWSQIIGKAIVGPAAGDFLKRRPSIIVTWKQWKADHPDTLVASFATGHVRDYERDPYAR